jgi:hypothetical protein
LEASIKREFHGIIFCPVKQINVTKKIEKLIVGFKNLTGRSITWEKSMGNNKINKMFVGAHIPYDVESCRMVRSIFG